MALGDDYAEPTQLKKYMGDQLTVDDDIYTAVLHSVSREIENHTHRQFNKTTTATARLYAAELGCVATVDEFHTATDLVVKTDLDGDGVFETTWAATDYQLEPLNGVVDGAEGWPYRKIRAVGTKSFPCGVRAQLQVTAQWGWDAVPDPVYQACLILAAETVKLKDAPFGIAGFGDFGAVRVRDNPKAATKLAPYVLNPILVG